jgi:hypothetical protein
MDTVIDRADRRLNPAHDNLRRLWTAPDPPSASRRPAPDAPPS